jgi:TonB-linked SusC/RagA family outer membrane protein
MQLHNYHYNVVNLYFAKQILSKFLHMKKNVYVIFMLFSFSSLCFSQINGNVSDQNGQSLPGVNIVVSGSDKNTVSDLDGNFTIEAEAGNELVFSMIGFQTLKMKATVTMNVVMREETNSLQEVVVIGYGTKKAGAITGSVAQVKATDIVRTPAQSAIQAIQGKSAGVNIVTNDEPGANPTIRIRGLGTITGLRDPLYVIDGIETGSMNGLSPNDIATIDILKDAASLAIYGQKGGNGVVIITTKTGKKGDFKVSYSGYYGQKFIQRDVDMADSYRFAYYNNAALGSSTYYNFTQPYNTNWLKEITSTGEVMNNSLAISGAGENSSYYFGITNYKEKGILNGTQFEKTNIILKNQYTLFNDRLKISPFANISISRNSPKPLNAFTNAYNQAPIVPVRYPTGQWGAPLLNSNGVVDLTGDRFNTVANPVAQLYYYNEQNKTVDLIAAFNAELKIFDFLKVTSEYSATAVWDKGYTFTPTRDIYFSQNPSSTVDEYIALYHQNPIINTLQQRRGTSYDWTWDNYLTFDQSFGNHNLKIIAGMTKSENTSEFLNATRQDVPVQSNYWSLNFATYNGATGPLATVQNLNNTPTVSVAYFSRAEYDYKGKYLLTAIFRREGSSVFQDAVRWKNFPSVSAGWVISDESFMQNIKFLNSLKLRGGYGEVGIRNQVPNDIVFDPNHNYSIGANPQIVSGVNIPFTPDPSLSWETMSEIDLGIDFTALKSRFSGTFDVYDRTSKHLILPIEVPVILSEGHVYLNSGEVSNKGYEVSLKWQDRIGDNWTYWVSGNYSYNKNELEKVDNQFFGDYVGGGLNNGQVTKQVLIGQPLGSFYVYQVKGFDSTGGFTYSDDLVAAGSYLPTFTYGFNLGLTYKHIDFSVDAYGVGGNKIYNGKKAQRMSGQNVESAVLDNFWIPSNPDAVNPAPFNDIPRASTYYIEDGDYLRINNITLGYTLNKMFTGLDKVRLYVTATNPFLFTKYSGYSPELSGSNNGDPLGGAGIELDAYPTNKTFLFGVNIDF